MNRPSFPPLLMDPAFSARPWGGDALARRLGKRPPTGGPWGEAWELSDHPDGRSRVANGPEPGIEFGELVRRHPRELCGVARAPERFPLLVKYIDAAEDLSIQVHPDDARAPAGERGKTECWYIIDCRPGAEIVHGLAAGVDAAELRQAAREGAMERCVRRVGIQPGDFVSIPAGTVHAILGGTLICEIQQSSNTTWRLWDWNRLPARTLHVEEACAVAECGVEAQAPSRTGAMPAGAWHLLLENEFFDVRTGLWEPGREGAVELENRHGVIVNVVEGEGTMRWGESEAALRLGQTWFLPAGLERGRRAPGAGGVRLLASRSRELVE